MRFVYFWFFENRYNFKTDDPLLLAQQLSALTSFGQGGTNGGYFRRDTQLLGAVLEKIFNSLTFIPQEEIEAIQQKNGSVSISIPPPSFKPVALFLSRISSILKQPKQVFF